MKFKVIFFDSLANVVTISPVDGDDLVVWINKVLDCYPRCHIEVCDDE